MPKVSTIITTYNRSHFLGTAIRSALDQTFQDFELIVVDDASPDDGKTERLVKSFDDPRIKYIRHERNQGIGATRNTGVRNASGEYIAFLDDDDEWLPRKLELQCKALDSAPPVVGVVYVGKTRFDSKNRSVTGSPIREYRGKLFDELLVRNRIGTSSGVMLRKICFETTGLFDEVLHYGEDYDMWLRISKTFEFECVNEPLVKYRIHEDKLTANHRKRLAAKERLVEKHQQDFARDRLHWHRDHYRLGWLYCYLGEAGKGRRMLVRAIRIYPYRLRPYIDLCLSLLGSKGFARFYQIKKRLRRYCLGG